MTWRKTGISLLATLALEALGVFGLAGSAAAHEERTAGAYHFAVGFVNEPAYTGQENGVALFLSDAKDEPVVDLGNTLNVTAEFGDQSLDLGALEPAFDVGEFGAPGEYRAYFFPTAPGKYTFRFTGSIHGQKVDESFTSSPTGFDEVVDPSSLEFPARPPTTAQLSDKLDREVPRLNDAIAAAEASAKDDANTLKTVAILGVVLGAVGLIFGIAGLTIGMRGRRSSPPAGAPARSDSATVG